MQKLVDLFIVYQIVKKFATPFTKTAAFKLGIISKTGLVLRPLRTLKTKEEKEAWTWLDVMINNLKRALIHLPGGQSRFFAYAASLYMLKEPLTELKMASTLQGNALLEHIMGPQHESYLLEATDMIHEDMAAPTNAAGSGQVAGLGVGAQGEPPMRRPEEFAGCKVFVVDSSTFHKCRFGKKRYSRYEHYVGTGPMGEEIKAYGRDNVNRKRGIIIMDNMTGSMFYLRRPKVVSHAKPKPHP